MSENVYDAMAMASWRPRCCRSTPRCRSCPLRLRAELKTVDALLAEPELPPHLAGLPRCLHRYEPLLRRLADERGRALSAESSPAPEPEATLAHAPIAADGAERATGALVPSCAGGGR